MSGSPSAAGFGVPRYTRRMDGAPRSGERVDVRECVQALLAFAAVACLTLALAAFSIEYIDAEDHMDSPFAAPAEVRDHRAENRREGVMRGASAARAFGAPGLLTIGLLAVLWRRSRSDRRRDTAVEPA